MPFYLFLWTPEIEAHVNEHGGSLLRSLSRLSRIRGGSNPVGVLALIAFGEIDGRLVACVYEDYDPYIEPVTAYYIED